MKWSEFFIPTTKETPSDAVVPSHQLMIRAGLIRQVVAGAYTYLPLGYRSLRKVEEIVREEMNAKGAIELHMPAMHPIEWWEQTGRVDAMGDVLLRLAGKGDDWRTRTCLGPTHEEVITEIAKAYINSYKQLPVNLYQIQTKFRGEARPKSGVLRTREFLMKDAYSFHTSKEGPGGLDETYDKMYDAYCRIFGRAGLPYVACEADSGPIGGDASHEFMVPTEAGEDVLVCCTACDYAANLERAECAPLPALAQSPAVTQLRNVHTPNLRTISEVCEFLNSAPSSMIKTLIYVTDTSETRAKARANTPIPVRFYIVLVRGDHEVNDAKLRRLIGESVQLADENGVQHVTGAKVGFAGPQGIQSKLDGSYWLIVDQAVTVMRDAISGANKEDTHSIGIQPGAHFPLSGQFVRVANIRNAIAEDRCPRCQNSLSFRKCIEVGHVFKLGTKYSDSMNATCLDQNGKPTPFIMGCYGIGLNRIMAAAIEAFHDENGIKWPASIAPFQAVVCALDIRDEAVTSLAQKLHDELAAVGVDVLLDDRDQRPGFKFKDADLIGFPVRVVVGKKGLAEGVVEVQVRKTGEVQKIAPDKVVSTVRAIVDEMLKNENTYRAV